MQLTSNKPEYVHMNDICQVSVETVKVTNHERNEGIGKAHPLESALSEFPSTRIFPSVVEETI